VTTFLYVIAGLGAGLLVGAAGLYALGRTLGRREPYRSFIKLRTRSKVRFFRQLIVDPRVPALAKALPLLLVVYLAFPIDLIPDFIPVLGYVDDVAIAVVVLALVIRLTPRGVVDELIAGLAGSEAE
jgi:uncharacterized membrane protein YkvA (DUF1232 family)